MHWSLRTAAGLLILSGVLGAAPNDWAEGTANSADGATRDCYNRAGHLQWHTYMGDWEDAAGASQGRRAYATATLVDDDTPRMVTWDITTLVQEWISGKRQNQGVLMHGLDGTGSFHFRSREYGDPAQRPSLSITTKQGTTELRPVADTYLEPSTYRSMGHQDSLRIAKGSNNALLRFDLSRIARGTSVERATLQLFTFAQYGNRQLTAAVFRCTPGEMPVDTKPLLGLAARYPGDRGIAADPDVIFFADFESASWDKEWSFASGTLEPLTNDAPRKLEPFQGKALRVTIAKGSNAAMNVGYKFKQKIGREPEAIYFRYYLRLGETWNQTLQGGKMPGISGTYGRAGWGGRRTDGRKGWSARGGFFQSIPDGNPLAGTHPIGTYCYHADQKGTYGDMWLWSKGYRGFLQKNRWYAIEQYLSMNTPGKKDGILRAWIDGKLAFEKTDIRFRHVDTLKIEQIWMNVYHGGKKPSPHDQHMFVDNVVIARKYIGPTGK